MGCTSWMCTLSLVLLSMMGCSYGGRVESLPVTEIPSSKRTDVAGLVIDAHSHAFNACDFPTPVSAFADRFVGSRAGLVGKWFANLLVASPRCVQEPWGDPPTNQGERDLVASAMRNRIEGSCDDDRSRPVGHCTTVDYLRASGWADKIRRGVAPYSHSRADQIAAMIRLYPRIDVFTPSLVDFHGFLYAETYDRRSLYDWMKQISAIADAVNSIAPGKVHPVVPYNPLRQIQFSWCPAEHNRDGSCPQPEQLNPLYDPDYLTRLAAAFANDGFVGIKMYSPTGFKPAGNCAALTKQKRIADDSDPAEVLPWAPLTVNLSITLPTDEQRSSLAARCPCLEGSDWSELETRKLQQRAYVACLMDLAADDLYGLAESWHVPIMTHGTPEGAALEKDYAWFARPEFWVPALAAHPWLKLSFAHFGGLLFSDPNEAPRMWRSPGKQRRRVHEASCLAWEPCRNSYWEYGYGEHCWWGRRIAELASSDLNANLRIFADLAYDNVSDLRGRWNHVVSITPGVANVKMMFGTDFPVLAQAHEGAIEGAYTSHAALAAGDPLLSKYMGANASEFFGFSDPLVQARLCRYYAKLQTKYPAARAPDWLHCR
jgi:hypothetical protein